MFDIHTELFDENGESDNDAVYEYLESLVFSAFAESPEGQEYIAAGDEIGWTHPFLRFGVSYLGETPPTMTRASVQEIVFDLFPRKVSISPDSATAIISELRCFWRFLQREYGLPNAAGILQDLDKDAEERLRSALGDPSEFGMAKTILAIGAEAGFDVTTQQGLAEFMAAYNAMLPIGDGPAARLEKEMTDLPWVDDWRVDPPGESVPRPRKADITAGRLTPEQRRDRKKRLRQATRRKR